MGAFILRLPRGAEADLQEELDTHRAMRQAQLERDGLTPSEAAEASRRSLGNVTLAREDATAVWQGRIAGSLWRDLRYSVRILRRSPGFACVAIVTLALGLGATTALFSVADEVLFRPLAVADPGHLVLFRRTSGPRGTMAGTVAGMNVDPATGESSSTAFSQLTFQRFRAEGRTLSAVFAFADGIRSVDMT